MICCCYVNSLPRSRNNYCVDYWTGLLRNRLCFCTEIFNLPSLLASRDVCAVVEVVVVVAAGFTTASACSRGWSCGGGMMAVFVVFSIVVVFVVSIVFIVILLMVWIYYHCLGKCYDHRIFLHGTNISKLRAIKLTSFYFKLKMSLNHLEQIHYFGPCFCILLNVAVVAAVASVCRANKYFKQIVRLFSIMMLNKIQCISALYANELILYYGWYFIVFCKNKVHSHIFLYLWLYKNMCNMLLRHILLLSSKPQSTATWVLWTRSEALYIMSGAVWHLWPDALAPARLICFTVHVCVLKFLSTPPRLPSPDNEKIKVTSKYFVFYHDAIWILDNDTGKEKTMVKIKSVR